MLSRQGTSEANPKSEYRNPKQTPRQINHNRKIQNNRIEELVLELRILVI